MAEDEEPEEQESAEVCDSCGAEGAEEGDLDLDENGICETCRENEEARDQLASDYRSWVL